MVFTDSAETKQPEQSSEAQGQETPSQESYLQKLVETKGESTFLTRLHLLGLIHPLVQAL